MKTQLPLVLLCVVAAVGCECISAKNHEARKSAGEAAASANASFLRNSYYQCAKTSNGETWTIQNCIENEFGYQDEKLNAVYRDLRSRLPAPGRARLRDEERKWLLDKEKACHWDASTEGQAQRLDANVCSLKKTAERAAQLEHRLRALDKP